MIDIVNYRTWKSDVVTKALLSALQLLRDAIEKEMTSADTILAKDCNIKMARLLGMRDGVDTVLNIEFEDLESNDGDDEDVENDQTSGTQSAGEVKEG